MLSLKQKRIFHFIRYYWEENSESPTLAEIGKEFRMSSPASVHSNLVQIESEGLIKRIPNVSRGIQIVEKT